MKSQIKIITVPVYYFLFMSCISAQKYYLETLNGEQFENLTYSSKTDTTIKFKRVNGTMGQQGKISYTTDYHTIHINDLKVISKHNNTFSKFGLQPAKFSIIRGLAGATAGGYCGTLIGTGIGYLALRLFTEDESFSEFNMFYWLGGATVGLVTGSVWNLIYFSKHKIGFETESYDLTNKSFDEKKLIVSLLVEQNETP
ncbi:MAG: hypothetical protein GXO90_03630 [FCB group bacterium]|nr:hypothetical protein [FCB group bacterium]